MSGLYSYLQLNLIGKPLSLCDSTIISFDSIPACDRRTDGQTCRLYLIHAESYKTSFFDVLFDFKWPKQTVSIVQSNGRQRWLSINAMSYPCHSILPFHAM